MNNPMDNHLNKIISQRGDLLFSDFMNIALYHDQYGYYNKEPTKELITKLEMKDSDLIGIMNKIIDKFKNNGINHLILGCTELPLFVKYNKISKKII